MTSDKARPNGDRSPLERIKETSRGLAGTLSEELADHSPDFTADAAQLLKFHGIYQQDDRDVRKERAKQGLGKDWVCMVRASVPGGALSADQYIAIDDLADKVGDGTLRVTTRQGVQYHFTRKGDLAGLVRSLNDHLVTTFAACGDVVRNIMCCPAPGGAGAAEVQQLATALSAEVKPQTDAYWQLWVDGERAASAAPAEPADAVATPAEPLYGPTYLPRKFKIGFALPGDNCIDVYTQDLGITPHIEDGRVAALTLLVGGGLGMSHNNDETYPRLADPLATVPPGDLTEVVQAIIGIQRDHGDRTDRKHARMKYLVAEWGVAAFKAELERRLGRSLSAPRELDWAATSDHLGWNRADDGTWTVGVRVASGRITDNGTRMRAGLRRVVEDLRCEVRLTPRQDVLLVGVPDERRAGVDEVLREHGIAPVETLGLVDRHALACPALPTCGLALAEAERSAPAVVAALEAELGALGLADEPIHVRMTGCPNGCARPYSTEIGIVGRGKDAYTIVLGGDALGTRLNSCYTDRVGLDDLVAVLRPVFVAYRDERRAGEAFGDFCDRVGVPALAERFDPQPSRPARRAPARA